jgi:hypothetical protein
MPADFTLREITVADGPAINALAANCPDAGLISVYTFFGTTPGNPFRHYILTPLAF